MTTHTSVKYFDRRGPKLASVLIVVLTTASAWGAPFRKCEDLFRQKPPVPVFVEWPDWRQADNPAVKKAIPNAALDPKVPIEGRVELAKLTPDQLRTIAYDREALLHFVGGYRDPYSSGDGSLSPTRLAEFADRIQLTARITYTRLKCRLLPSGPAFSQAEFAQQARLAGLPLELAHVAYRFDERSPNEIFGKGGFFPNPEKRSREISLLEHSLRSTTGGFFVSTTLQEDNPHILPSAMFSNHLESQSSGLALLLSTGVSRAEIGLVTAIRKAYEFRIENVIGVRGSDHGIKMEEEFVTNFIPSTKIAAAREVTLVEFFDPREASFLPSDLQSNPDLPESRARLSVVARKSPFTIRKILFGPWEPVPFRGADF